MSTHIYKGRRYNTTTAVHIGSASQCHGSFSDYDEDLYKTPKGTFFLVGSGGPMSRYAQSCGENSWGGGSGFEVLSTEEALAWCEHNDVDYTTMETHFSLIDA